MRVDREAGRVGVHPQRDSVTNSEILAAHLAHARTHGSRVSRRAHGCSLHATRSHCAAQSGDTRCGASCARVVLSCCTQIIGTLDLPGAGRYKRQSAIHRQLSARPRRGRRLFMTCAVLARRTVRQRGSCRPSAPCGAEGRAIAPQNLVTALSLGPGSAMSLVAADLNGAVAR